MKISGNDLREIRAENAMMANCLLRLAFGAFVLAPVAILAGLAAVAAAMFAAAHPLAVVVFLALAGVFATWRKLSGRRLLPNG